MGVGEICRKKQEENKNNNGLLSKTQQVDELEAHSSESRLQTPMKKSQRRRKKAAHGQRVKISEKPGSCNVEVRRNFWRKGGYAYPSDTNLCGSRE